MGGNTFYVSNSNVLDHWNPAHHNHLSKFLDVERRIILGLDICYLLYNINGLHDLGVLAMLQQHIAAAWPAS